MNLDPNLERLFADIPEALSNDPDFVNDLTGRTKVIVVKKGDYLLRTNELCQDAYFINKGVFINLYVNEKGDETVTGFASDTEYPFLSAVGYFTRQPSDFAIKAIEPGELLCFSRDHIEELSSRYPLFAGYYQNVMLTLIFKLYTLSAIRRSCTTEEFIKYLYLHYKWVVNRVPDKYIARYMGISNAWFCKVKKGILK